MNWGFYLSGFGLGSVKFMFAQATMFGIAVKMDGVEPTLWNIFIPTYLGAIFGMAVFYFASDFFMDRAVAKKEAKIKLALANGVTFKKKKIFTKMNKLMVWLKMKFGIYGITFLAPLLLSIPIGSAVCAKFYGDSHKTYPLMVMFMGVYAFVVTIVLLSFNG